MEQIEIRRTSHNIFDGFNNSSKNIVKVATHKEDASKDVEMEKILMKINLKREKDRLRIARMERLDLKRKEWKIRSISNGIVNELMEEMEVVEMKTWVTGIDALVDTLEIDRERFARSAKVMEVEEDWLTEVFSRMMEHKSITVIKESTRMGEEVIEIKGSQVTPSDGKARDDRECFQLWQEGYRAGVQEVPGVLGGLEEGEQLYLQGVEVR